MSEFRIKTYDSLQVMNYLLKRAIELKLPLMNTTKAQKLMYCIYGTFLGKFDYRISNETPEAWLHGPVFPRTLRAMNAQGYEKYTLQALVSDVNVYLPIEYRDFFDEILTYFGKFSAYQLSCWSKENGSPWYGASGGGTIFWEQLDDEVICKYFKDHVLS